LCSTALYLIVEFFYTQIFMFSMDFVEVVKKEQIYVRKSGIVFVSHYLMHKTADFAIISCMKAQMIKIWTNVYSFL
jgi:hypothetical protein